MIVMVASLCCGSVITGPVTASPPLDERIQWLRDHAVELVTAGPDADDRDLAPLAELLAGVRVVQLGEQTHGDGTAFLLRTRLVHFLHERLGFDALAFESGFYECRAVQVALRDPAVGLHDAVDRGIFAIWAESRQIQPLFELVRDAHARRPLDFLGYDVQFSRPETEARLTEDLISWFGRSPGTRLTPEQQAELRALIKALASAGRISIDAETHTVNQQLLQQMRAALLRAPSDEAMPPEDRRWWDQVLSGLQRLERSMHLASLAPPLDPRRLDESFRAPHRILSAGARDLGMAQNLQWWLEGPGRDGTLIVWAANNHVAHGSRRRAVEPLPGDDDVPIYEPAGSHLKRMLEDDLYTILAVSYAGRWAAPSIRTVEGELRWTNGTHAPAEAGSLAELLHQSGFDFALLDLRQVRDDPEHWLNEQIVIRQDILNGEPVVPARFCDGLLFIDEMQPSEPRAAD
ncbi:MAG: erythromycin esterase family protein [Planctomycetota bacterium]|jgi:erythromycin esterase